MSDVKLKSKRLSFRKSPLHGWGVFADEFIKKGEVVESVPAVDISHAKSTVLFRYRFDISDDPENPSIYRSVVPGGHCMFYNHSEEENNIAWDEWNHDTRVMTFIATKDIKKDQEILLFYGNDQEQRSHVEENHADDVHTTENLALDISYFLTDYFSREKKPQIQQLSHELTNFIIQNTVVKSEKS